MPKGNVPYKFTQEAQDERDWKKAKTRDGENYNYAKYDKKAYESNYDAIDWSKK
tara:strand:+ start:151 stop:312 length:162 start_codon:yes stop_codon:yes gene_type:complete